MPPCDTFFKEEMLVLVALVGSKFECYDFGVLRCDGLKKVKYCLMMHVGSPLEHLDDMGSWPIFNARQIRCCHDPPPLSRK